MRACVRVCACVCIPKFDCIRKVGRRIDMDYSLDALTQTQTQT